MTDKLKRNIDRAYRAHKLVSLIAVEVGPHYPIVEALRQINECYQALQAEYAHGQVPQGVTLYDTDKASTGRTEEV